MLCLSVYIVFYKYIPLLYNMDFYTRLFWMFFFAFIILSGYLVCCTKKTNIFYIQIASGCGMFATSKIGRTFLKNII